MKLLKTLALALCLVSLCTPLLSKAQTLDPTQVYTTGNIVQTTPQGGPTPWVNGVYQDNLTCWSWGDPGYCGPNAIVRPGNNINFSFGQTDLYQSQAIASVLPSTITGLRVNGYNFSFTAKNGNGWDNGQTDYLTAYVHLKNSGGNVVEYDAYNLTYRYNWSDFNLSKNFTSPYPVSSLGNITYGFVGRDSNGWAGPYGPEIYNVSFSLKYSVDPCASNGLSSPTCPGYLDALAKLAPPPPAPTIVTEVTVPSPMIIDSGPVNQSGQPVPPAGNTPPPLASASPQPQDGPPPQQQAGPATAGPPMPGPVQQASVAQPSSGGQQTKVGEVNDSGGSSKSTVSLSSVLSMIGSNQEKTAALEKSVVQSADAQAFSAGETAKQQAEKIASDQQSQSMSASGGPASTTQSSSSQTSFTQTPSSMASLQASQQFNNASNATRIQSISSSVSSQSNETNFISTTTQQSSYQNTTRQEINTPISTSSITYSLTTPTRQSVQTQVEIPMLEGIKFGFKNAVDSAMESKPFVPLINDNSQQVSSVKRNVENNELAGNISIESIAKQPANYAQYFTIIPDVAFYAPKEIYKNQKTIDNARALRQLSSDRLHQDLVNLQYK